MEKKLRICMTGFGNVGRKFCTLLEEKKTYLKELYGYEIIVTGIATGSKGILADPKGLDTASLLLQFEQTGLLSPTADIFVESIADMMDVSKAGLFIEMSPLSINDGQPAASYIEHAFHHQMHVITANKGPEAWYFNKLNHMAETNNLKFLYETIVMDGTPVFNLVDKTLHGNKILGIEGILNGTSNYVLSQLEKGLTYEEAIKSAQALGLAEANPAMDMDGWDGAAKICAMANILMDAKITPKDVAVESAVKITREEIIAAKKTGCCIKYICKAAPNSETQKLEVSVKPEKLPLSHPYSNVNDTSAAVTFYTDLAGEITIIQTDPGLLQTAYGIYSDLITLLKSLK